MSFNLPGQAHNDPNNPYSAPPPTLGYRQRTDLDIGQVLSQSWNIYKEQMGLCIGVTLVWYVIVQGAPYAVQMVALVLLAARVSPFAIAGIMLFGVIAVFCATVWITAGLYRFFLNVAGGRNARFNDLFSAGPYSLAFFFSSLIFYLAIFSAVGVAAVIPVGAAVVGGGKDQNILIGGIVLGALIATVIGFLAWIRLSMYHFLILDDRAGTIDSLASSLEVTRGKALNLFVIYLVGVVLILAGTMACLVGVIFTGPFTYLLSAVTYLTITGQPVADLSAAYQKPDAKQLTEDDFA